MQSLQMEAQGRPNYDFSVPRQSPAYVLLHDQTPMLLDISRLFLAFH